MKKLWIATTNKGKLEEIKMILKNAPFELHTLSELSTYSAPAENGKTFLENARIKAKSLKSIKRDDWVLAEDSGLEVEGLNGLPGIHSARYAGDKASDNENVAKLLKMILLRAGTNRNARFFCSLVVIDDQQKELSFSGTMNGSIAKAPAGLLGFGYDSVFIPQGESKTLGELGPGIKNQKSHRRQALDEFLKTLSL